MSVRTNQHPHLLLIWKGGIYDLVRPFLLVTGTAAAKSSAKDRLSPTLVAAKDTVLLLESEKETTMTLLDLLTGRRLAIEFGYWGPLKESGAAVAFHGVTKDATGAGQRDQRGWRILV